MHTTHPPPPIHIQQGGIGAEPEAGLVAGVYIGTLPLFRYIFSTIFTLPLFDPSPFQISSSKKNKYVNSLEY
jgi:hypothetical protein